MRRLVAFALALASLTCAASAAAQGTGFDAVLKPLRSGGEVAAIEVQSELRAQPGTPLVLNAPGVYAAVEGVADRVQDLQVTDAAGPVALTTSDDPAAPGGFPYYRHWTAQRGVTYPVTVRYRSLVQPAGSRNGPPFGIRTSGGGVSGAGSGFLVLPEKFGKAPLKVRWDLSDMPQGSFAVTSFGEGAFELVDDPAQLRQGWYLAGPAQRFPTAGDAGGFSAAWLGAPPWDAQREMAWAAQYYAWLGKEFAYLDPPPPYRVFMRFLETPPYGGGTALRNSFMLSRGPGAYDPKAEGPRGTFAHEMIHQWVGGIESPGAVGVSSWFSEGLTTYYTAVLPLRGGFTSLDEYARRLDAMAEGYWGSPAREWSAERIARAGFGQENIRHVPYNRTALYFADLDARIRARSGGTRTLDDVLQPLFRGRERGMRFDHAAWKATVVRELGPEAGEEFERIVLGGGMFTPAANAFGPCFRLAPKTYKAEAGELAGYGWERVRGVPEAKCRRW